METKIMGSIYFNGAAMGPGFNCKGSSDISFGDAAPKKELQWVDVGNRLVADRCVRSEKVGVGSPFEADRTWGSPLALERHPLLGAGHRSGQSAHACCAGILRGGGLGSKGQGY